MQSLVKRLPAAGQRGKQPVAWKIVASRCKSREGEAGLMNQSEDRTFMLLIGKSICKRNPQKGWDGFTVFGRDVLFGEVFEL